MKDFNTFLLETYKNLFVKDKEDRQNYVDQVWDLLQNSYAKIGGIKGSGFQSKDDMIKNIPFWKLVIKDNKVVALAMYKDKNGRKRVAIATDGTIQGKKALKDLFLSEYRTGRAYGEVSGPSLRFIKKLFSDAEFSSFLIPVEKVVEILSDDEIKPIDKFTYERKIGSSWQEKVMIGNPNAPRIT